jgi:ornithine--oxo-acid transaminase
MPVGAVLVRSDIWASTFSSMDRAIVHSSTLHESALAMTALIATVEVVVQDGLAKRAQHLGALLLQRLQAECAGCECVREVRGRGLMVGIDLDAGKVPHLGGVPMVGHLTEPLVGQSATMSLLADHAVLAQTTGARRPLLKFVPPLVIDESDVEWIATAAGSVCKGLAAGSFYGALGRVASNAVRGALGVR